MGYLCVTAPSLAGVKEQAGGRLRSRERQELREEERGGLVSLALVLPHPRWHALPVSAPTPGSISRYCLAQAEAVGCWGAGVAFWEEEGPYSSY